MKPFSGQGPVQEEERDDAELQVCPGHWSAHLELDERIQWMSQEEDVVPTTRPGASVVENGGQMSRPLPTLLGLARGLTAPPSKPSDVERWSSTASAPPGPEGAKTPPLGRCRRGAIVRCNDLFGCAA